MLSFKNSEQLFKTALSIHLRIGNQYCCQMETEMKRNMQEPICWIRLKQWQKMWKERWEEEREEKQDAMS